MAFKPAHLCFGKKQCKFPHKKTVDICPHLRKSLRISLISLAPDILKTVFSKLAGQIASLRSTSPLFCLLLLLCSDDLVEGGGGGGVLAGMAQGIIIIMMRIMTLFVLKLAMMMMMIMTRRMAF